MRKYRCGLVMDDRDIVSYNHADSLLAYLQAALAEGQLCDVTVNLDGQFVARCHRLILAAMSTNLATMFSNMDKSAELTVDFDSKLTNIHFDDLKNVLDYFYLGRIQHTRTLIDCAQSLQCESLLSLVSNKEYIHDSQIQSIVLQDHNHANRLLIEIRRLYLEARFVDVTLSVQGYTTAPNLCHRLMLCAFSEHFETALERTENSAHVVLEVDPTSSGVSNTDLRSVIDFMYYGMLRVVKRKLKGLVYAAKALSVSKMLEMLTTGESSVTTFARLSNDMSYETGLNLAAFGIQNGDRKRELETSYGVLAKEDDYMELYEEYVSGPRRGRKGGTYATKREPAVIAVKPASQPSTSSAEELLLDDAGVSGDATQRAAVTMSVGPTVKRARYMDSFGYGLPELHGTQDVTVPLLVGDQQVMMEKPFKCPYCDHRTKEKSAIEKHIRCIHTLEAPYKCTYCSQAFKVQSNLVRHIRAHTGEKPYVCKKCGAAYADKKNMDAHVFREHLKMKALECPHPGCNAKFWRQDRYEFHCRRSHNINIDRITH